jgi:hypothetical protein
MADKVATAPDLPAAREALGDARARLSVLQSLLAKHGPRGFGVAGATMYQLLGDLANAVGALCGEERC